MHGAHYTHCHSHSTTRDTNHVSLQSTTSNRSFTSARQRRLCCALHYSVGSTCTRGRHITALLHSRHLLSVLCAANQSSYIAQTQLQCIDGSNTSLPRPSVAPYDDELITALFVSVPSITASRAVAAVF